jgi:hypothetical protein
MHFYSGAPMHFLSGVDSEGAVDVVQRQGNTFQELGRVPTVSGARTSLFVPDLDRLFVAVRASGQEPAAVWIYRPAM